MVYAPSLANRPHAVRPRDVREPEDGRPVDGRVDDLLGPRRPIEVPEPISGSAVYTLVGAVVATDPMNEGRDT